MKKTLVAAFTLSVVIFTVTASATTIPINPRDSFLITDEDDKAATNATAIDLAPYGAGGDWIILTQLGDYAAHDYDTTDRYTPMIGVFSETDILLGSDLRYRVPGAIDAGEDFVTENTYHENHVTDIPEDFWLEPGTPMLIQIPWEAHFLFIATVDDFYGDNHENTPDFAVQITSAPPVPEPASIALLGLGVLGMALRRKKSAI